MSFFNLLGGGVCRALNSSFDHFLSCFCLKNMTFVLSFSKVLHVWQGYDYNLQVIRSKSVLGEAQFFWQMLNWKQRHISINSHTSLTFLILDLCMENGQCT